MIFLIFPGTRSEVLAYCVLSQLLWGSRIFGASTCGAERRGLYLILPPAGRGGLEGMQTGADPLSAAKRVKGVCRSAVTGVPLHSIGVWFNGDVTVHC